MRSFTVSVKSDEGSEAHSRVEIPDDEWALLLAFANCAHELTELNMLQCELRVQISIGFDKASGLRVGGTLPSNDEVAALLHRVRPFVLQKEPSNFLRICGILNRRMTHPALRRIVTRQRDEFLGKEFQKEVRIVTTTPALAGILNSDKLFQDWLNAFEYHRDVSRRATIEQLCGVLGFDAARAIFISMLIDKVRAILKVAGMIRHCEQADGLRHKI